MSERTSQNPSHGRPPALKVLVGILGVFAFVGFMSGYALLSSPSGEGLGLSLDLLEDAPVGDFTLVGLHFVAFFGVLPSMAIYGLWTKKRWSWTDPIDRRVGRHWSWTATVALGIVLLLWIATELVLVGPLSGIGGALQVAMTLLALVFLAMANLPSVKSATKHPEGG